MSLGTTITPGMVRELIITELSDNEIESAITSALVLYRNYLDGSALNNDLQIEIKRYLAAHFVSVTDRTTTTEQEKIGDASVTFKGGPGKSPSASDLSSSTWGATAIMFDPTGILVSLGRAPAALKSLNSPASPYRW